MVKLRLLVIGWSLDVVKEFCPLTVGKLKNQEELFHPQGVRLVDRGCFQSSGHFKT